MEEDSAAPRDLTDSFQSFYRVIQALKSNAEYSTKVPALKIVLNKELKELKAKGASDEAIALLKALAQESVDAQEHVQEVVNSLEARFRQVATEIENGLGTLQAEVGTLSKDAQAKAIAPRRQPTHKGWFSALLYPAAFLIVVGITAALVAQNKAAQPTVAINYDIGAIIQGALVGIGALVAGGAYAAKALSPEQSKE